MPFVVSVIIAFCSLSINVLFENASLSWAKRNKKIFPIHTFAVFKEKQSSLGPDVIEAMII